MTRQELKLGMLCAAAFGLALVGCSDSEPPNPPGPEANSGKDYSADEANKAQPVRGDSLKDKE